MKLLAVVLVALALAPAAGAATPAASERAILRSVNAARVERGLRPLRLDPALRRAARAHAGEMLKRGSLGHGDFRRRMVTFKVEGPIVAEDLAWGIGSRAEPRTMVAEWLASPVHRANLLRPGFNRIGIGAARGTFHGLPDALVVTADFAGS
ncbi:MAG TPA: CAP domain-containing protein [Gaiellaceae bacterium]